MGAAYRWHPGQASVAPKWAISIALQPDESISSWLARAALVHGCSPVSLAAWIWPGWRTWTTDVDRGVPREQLATLEKVSGIKRAAFEAAALEPIASRIEGRVLERNRVWRWILPRGRASDQRQGSAQYCPECLAEDGTPYHRLTWRLAWYTACATHGTTLADRCGQCGTAVRLHRLDGSARHTATCSACGADLREYKRGGANASALAFQDAGDRTVQSGAGTCLGQSVDTTTWFAVAEFLIVLIRRMARQQTRPMSALMAALEIDGGAALSTYAGAAIERLETEARIKIIEGVWRIMSSSTETFQDALLRSEISRQAVCERKQTAPGPIASLLPALPENGRRQYARRTAIRRRPAPRSRSQVLRMMRRLEKEVEAEGRDAQ